MWVNPEYIHCSGFDFSEALCKLTVACWKRSTKESNVCVCRNTRTCSSGRCVCVTQCRWRRRRRWMASRGASTRAGPPPSTSPPHRMRLLWWKGWKGKCTKTGPPGGSSAKGSKCFSVCQLLSPPLVARLGYTYLRLRDNYMEILNKDDEIERSVC